MSITNEYPERYGWWISELNSLGIKEGKRDDNSNKQQLKDLAENIKQRLYTKYRVNMVNGCIKNYCKTVVE